MRNQTTENNHEQTLPQGMSRLMTVSVAAAYCSMSVSKYRRHVNEGLLPAPMAQFNRIDRLALDIAISGFPKNAYADQRASNRADIAAWRSAKLRKEQSHDR